MSGWYFDPQSGGNKIPLQLHQAIISRANAFALTRPWYPKFQLKLRFRSQFCYLDASEKDQQVFPIGRLRYFGPNKWSLAFYTYSNERYEPCFFPTGDWFGTLEEAIEVCEMYLQ